MTVPQCGHFRFIAIRRMIRCSIFDAIRTIFYPKLGPIAGLDKSASIRLLRIAAFFANAVDLKSVAGGNIAVLASDLLLQLSDLLREKFDGSAALGTNHVVMTAAVVLVS